MIRPSTCTDIFCTLKVPHKLAYDWKYSIVANNYAGCVNESLKVPLLDKGNDALQNRLKAKLVTKWDPHLLKRKAQSMSIGSYYI